MSHARDRFLSLAKALRRAAAATSPTWFTLLICVAALLLARTEPGEQRRERVFDLLLSGLSSLPPKKEIVIVDIDRRSLVSMGPWPWGRDKMASLLDVVADTKPRSIGVDILFDGPDGQSLAALARRLSRATGRDDIAHLAETLPDGDQRLAAAIKRAPTSLGVALSPDPVGGTTPKAKVVMDGAPREDNLWHAKGVVGPMRPLADAASGLGVVLLRGDSDAKVRRVPLVVHAGGRLWPSLAVEVVRNYRNGSSVVLAAGKLEVTGQAVPADSDSGTMRLLPLRHDQWANRTISALEIHENPEARQRLVGRIVLIGSSAPELGMLRAAATGSLVPSIVLHAAAAEQILGGLAPTRSRRIVALEIIASLGACVLAIWLVQATSPLVGTLIIMLPAILWMVGSLVLISRQQLLVDPFSVPMLAVGCFTLAGFLTTTANKRREAAMRRRFEQHLAPEVVRRLAAQPGRAKLEGESREITALFTDVEGFTAMTGRIDARTLVSLLDRYFDGATEIVVKHGGMVEKIVGDGIHAIFNAPFDLVDHPRQAVDCAVAVRDFSERFRKEDGQAAAAGFGRTRIGIETGVVVVGDVGGGRKLDYTAHGEAMNMAARFEAANKTLGSSICIGPTTAARFPSHALRPLGRVEVRGRGAPAEVFDPWPEAVAEEDRITYLTAFALAERDPMAAADSLERLANQRPDDLVPAKLAARLRFVGITVQLADIDRRRYKFLGEAEVDQ